MRLASAFRIQDNAFAISVVGAILLVLLQLAVTMVVYFGAGIAFSSLLSEGWVDALADTGLTALVVAFFMVLSTELNSPRRFHRPDPKALLLLLVIALPAKCYAMFAVTIVEKLFEWLPIIPASFLDYEGPDNSLFTWYSYCILAPISEEIFYRAIVGAGLIRWYGEKKGLLFSTAIFALVHLNPSSIANAAVLGIVLQWLYSSTNNLVYPLILHALVNAFALFVTTETGNDWLIGLPDSLVYVVAALLFVGGSLFIVGRKALADLFNGKPSKSEMADKSDQPAPEPVEGG